MQDVDAVENDEVESEDVLEVEPADEQPREEGPDHVEEPTESEVVDPVVEGRTGTLNLDVRCPPAVTDVHAVAGFGQVHLSWAVDLPAVAGRSLVIDDEAPEALDAAPDADEVLTDEGGDEGEDVSEGAAEESDPIAPPEVDQRTDDEGIEEEAADEEGEVAEQSVGEPTVTAFVVHVMPGERLITVAGDARSTVVIGLRNGTTYTFAIFGVNERGRGAGGDTSATPVTGMEGEVAGVLVKFTGDAPATGSVPGADRVDVVDLEIDRKVSEDVHLVEFSDAVDAVTAARIADELEADPGVEWAEPDQFVFISQRDPDPRAPPDDPLFANQQWNLWGDYGVGVGDGPDALNPEWSPDLGAGVTVAVIDTGITDHPDLAGQTVAGYDFVSNPLNLAAPREPGGALVEFDADGQPGWDADPTDPGDWRNVPPVRASTWHGTHIAGIISARTSNAEGITGLAPGARVQPVRAISWRGGLLSDITAAITWASGGELPGIPVNATPSKVLNLSFTLRSPCTSALQSAITDANTRGSVVIAAAGNANDDVASYAPANCEGTIAVAATGRDGKRAPYSNYGPGIDIAAPGGNFATGTGVLSASNPGYATREGTSIAAAHVTGVTTRIVAANPTATPADIRAALTRHQAIRPFPNNTCDPDTGKTCGTGIAKFAQISSLNPCPAGMTEVTSTPLVCEIRLIESGTFRLPQGVVAATVAVVGGGGGGGGGCCTATTQSGGGGGGGGVEERVLAGPFIEGARFIATIGRGGTGGVAIDNASGAFNRGGDGADSTLELPTGELMTSAGGKGGGGGWRQSGRTLVRHGGTGGNSGGIGNGASGSTSVGTGGGGGGSGADGLSDNTNPNVRSPHQALASGGAGSLLTQGLFFDSGLAFGGGGGGGASCWCAPENQSPGGIGGGARGVVAGGLVTTTGTSGNIQPSEVAGTPNSGGGGGGGMSGRDGRSNGGAGADGVVIIRVRLLNSPPPNPLTPVASDEVPSTYAGSGAPSNGRRPVNGGGPPTAIQDLTVRRPGSALVRVTTESGESVRGELPVVVVPLPRRDGKVVRAPSWDVELQGVEETGTPAPLNASGNLEVVQGRGLATSGRGFAPDSAVGVYLFSEPRTLGTLQTDAQGVFSGVVPVPDDVPVGVHTAQVSGYTPDGDILVVSLGIEVAAPQVNPLLNPIPSRVQALWWMPVTTSDGEVVVQAGSSGCSATDGDGLGARGRSLVFWGLGECVFEVRSGGKNWKTYRVPIVPNALKTRGIEQMATRKVWFTSNGAIGEKSSEMLADAVPRMQSSQVTYAYWLDSRDRNQQGLVSRQHAALARELRRMGPVRGMRTVTVSPSWQPTFQPEGAQYVLIAWKPSKP